MFLNILYRPMFENLFINRQRNIIENHMRVFVRQNTAQLHRVLPVPSFAHHFHLNTVDVPQPGPFVHNILDRNAHSRHGFAQLQDTARSIAERDGKPQQTSLSGQTPFQASAENSRIDISATQQQHHSASERTFKKKQTIDRK